MWGTITRNSVVLLKDRLQLVLPASKTDPFRQGVTIIVEATDGPTCAVKSVRHLMEKFRFPGNSPLFRLQNSTFTRQFVTNTLRTSLARLGVEGNYSGHSFRREAATSAKEAGLSDVEIQLLGRWKSNSYRFYIDLGFDKLWNISWRHLR